MLAWTEACKVRGFQSLLFNDLFAKSQIDSDMIPHSEGQGDPPKVSRRVILPCRPLGVELPFGEPSQDGGSLIGKQICNQFLSQESLDLDIFTSLLSPN